MQVTFKVMFKNGLFAKFVNNNDDNNGIRRLLLYAKILYFFKSCDNHLDNYKFLNFLTW